MQYRIFSDLDLVPFFPFVSDYGVFELISPTTCIFLSFLLWISMYSVLPNFLTSMFFSSWVRERGRMLGIEIRADILLSSVLETKRDGKGKGKE